MAAVLLCDHQLDPRLRKRVSWLKKIFGRCDAFVDMSRGSHFSDGDVNQNCISNFNTKKCREYDIVYVSGVRIVLRYLWLFLRLRLAGTQLIYEIPDLPLRSHSRLKNELITLIFSLIVKVLFDRVVLTSEAFKRKLPKDIDYFICENFLSYNFSINKKVNKERSESEKVRISFVGVIRYLDQMKLLIRYASERDIIVNFFGGPVDESETLRRFASELASDNIMFHGKFEQGQLPTIYENTDYVYSVYDGRQENVRLALPNKLYESIYFNTPIIVSKGTYLSEVTEQQNCGFSVDSLYYEEFCRDMDKGISNKYNFDLDALKIRMERQYADFNNWVFRKQVNSECSN